MARLLRSKSRSGGTSSTSAVETRRRYERDCATYLAELSGAAGQPGQGGAHPPVRLVAAIGTLLLGVSDAEAGAPSGERSAARGGGRSAAQPSVPFDALLRATDRALEVEGRQENQLALRLSEAAVVLRPRSKGAWRQRGRALEAAGQLTEAITAYETYVMLDGGEAHHVRRGELLREQQAVLTKAVSLLPVRGELAPVRGELAEQFAASVRGGQPLARIRTAFSAHLGHELAVRGAADPTVRQLAALYSTHSRLLAYGPSATAGSPLGDADPFGVPDLRGYLDGRTVCVVQGPAEVPAGAYDLVIRCDTLPNGTPQPLHVHATKGTTHTTRDVRRQGWAQQADVRLVLDEDPRPAGWQEAVRALVPGAQRYVGDGSLRRPLSDPALLGEEQWGSTPSTPFVMLRLLDFLDVNPRIDLLVPPLPADTMRPQERAWLLRRQTEDSTQTRISLR